MANILTGIRFNSNLGRYKSNPRYDVDEKSEVMNAGIIPVRAMISEKVNILENSIRHVPFYKIEGYLDGVIDNDDYIKLDDKNRLMFSARYDFDNEELKSLIDSNFYNYDVGTSDIFFSEETRLIVPLKLDIAHVYEDDKYKLSFVNINPDSYKNGYISLNRNVLNQSLVPYMVIEMSDQKVITIDTDSPDYSKYADRYNSSIVQNTELNEILNAVSEVDVASLTSGSEVGVRRDYVVTDNPDEVFDTGELYRDFLNSSNIENDENVKIVENNDGINISDDEDDVSINDLLGMANDNIVDGTYDNIDNDAIVNTVDAVYDNEGNDNSIFDLLNMSNNTLSNDFENGNDGQVNQNNQGTTDLWSEATANALARDRVVINDIPSVESVNQIDQVDTENKDNAGENENKSVLDLIEFLENDDTLTNSVEQKKSDTDPNEEFIRANTLAHQQEELTDSEQQALDLYSSLIKDRDISGTFADNKASELSR